MKGLVMHYFKNYKYNTKYYMPSFSSEVPDNRNINKAIPNQKNS